MARRWQKEEETYLKRYAKQKTLAELTERFETKAEEVEAKLTLLELTTKDGRGHHDDWVDPMIEVFARGLEEFHSDKITAAAKTFDEVIGQSDRSDLVAKAKIFRSRCDQLTAGDEEEAPDPYLEAVVAKNRGELETALEICSRGGRRGKDERFAYLAASSLALSGELDQAMEVLKQAIEMNPENRIHAYHDPDFEAMRGHEEFDALYEQ